MAGADQRGRGLAEEAIWLARVLLQLMPGEAEIQGLLALMLHCEARRAARRACGGKWGATWTRRPGCNRPGLSLCLSTLLGGSRSPARTLGKKC
jgi:hypothetical protein